MKAKNLKQRIKSNQLTIGTWLTIGHTSVVEVLTQANFDWIAIDVEHNLIGLETLRHLIIAGQANGTAMFVRVAKNDEVCIKYALDAGADGIIVPMINSVEDAEKSISYAYYPPKGKRGVGLSRAQGYGDNFSQYLSWVDKELTVIGQIEHIDAINDLESITKVDGIDALMIGPYDLSASMGYPGQFDRTDVKEAIDKFNVVCKKNVMARGLHIVPIEEYRVENAVKENYSFIAFGTDFNFLKAGLKSTDTLK
jgi:2-dehydro-3-deoxyglucarate aldolase